MGQNIWEEIRSKLALSDLGKPALVGLAAIFVMVAVLAGHQIIDTATATEVQIEHVQEDPVGQGADATTTVYVHVSGAVGAPGLYELPEGARVGDAIDSAGGFAPDAQPESVNLARQLQDGEQVHVASESDAAIAVSGSETAGAAGAGATQPASRTNINTASAEELQALPGVGPSTAQKIVSDRASNGPFATVEDLKRVSGIGDKKFEALLDSICV